jgi:hypothetical protein
MGEIKSAFDLAMEKAQKLEKASPEELARWKYYPEGERMAARYLQDECHLAAELSTYAGDERDYVSRGAEEILLRNIDLPQNDFAKGKNRKAMEGIKLLKSDRATVENVYSKMRRLFSHYEQEGEEQRRQAYEALKGNFQEKAQQAVQQQFGSSAGMRIDVERQPQFQEEWRRTQAQLDSQYHKLLDEYKQEIASIP